MSSFNEKYKPINISKLIIDTKIKDFLCMLLEFDDLNIIFCGNNGFGKTTLIECMIQDYIKKFNISKTEKKSNILHVNTLQEQNIHQFRENIKTFCQTTSTNSNIRKKIMVLDDIDTLTESNQQIIRHCMNKYETKIHFICSCSNIQKVNDNIQSRTNIIQIPTIKTNKLMTLIHNVCKLENITISNKCCSMIIKISDNSPRVILNNLEKLSLYDKNIEVDNIKNICTSINFDIFDKYTNTWFNKRDFNKSYKILLNICKNGYSVLDVLESYYQYVKISNMLNEEYKLQLLPIICKYINIFYSVHEDNFEMILFTNELIKTINN